MQIAKRGAHAPPFLLSAPEGFKSFENIYGADSLADGEHWMMNNGVESDGVGVRIITAAPEVEGVMEAVNELAKRNVVFSIGHRYGDPFPDR